MLYHRLPLFMSLFFNLFIACSDPMISMESEEEEAEEKIINGRYAAGDTAVVGIGFNQQFYCTGTLIRPKIVLTAGHCVAMFHQDTLKTSYWSTLGTLQVYVVRDGRIVETANVTDSIMHPEWDGEDLLVGADIGLLYLNKRLTIPTPMSLDTTVPQQRVGTIGKSVGYGLTNGFDANSNPNQQKRSVNLVVHATTEDQRIMELRSPDAVNRGTCNGDSGGPFIMNLGNRKVVSSVTSFGLENCIGSSYHISVQPHRAWILANIPVPINGNRRLPLPTCFRLKLCKEECSTEACRQSCFQQASAIAQQEYQVLQACVQQYQCLDQSCLDSQCMTQMNACYTQELEGQ